MKDSSIAIKHAQRRLATALKEGKARIVGKCSGGNRWPDFPHYWIIEDLERLETFHVPVDDKPSWKKYSPIYAD